MGKARAALALLLAFAVPVRAETTSDPLWYLLSTYVLAPDAKAVEARGDGSADSKGLAALQSDLLLLTDGFEGFRDEAQVKETLERLKPRMSPELRPFFKDRTSSLDAIYRTLAVTDYTWALRFPEPPCDPAEARRKLLASRDGLFQTEKGEATPWLSALLGPQAEVSKAKLEGLCRPLEEIAEEICGPEQQCRHGVLRALGYDFESCFDRWKQDGDGSPGSLGQPGIPRANPRPANRRCIPTRKVTTRTLSNGNSDKKGAHTGRKYDVSPGARAAYRSMMKLLLRGARFFKDTIYLIMTKAGGIDAMNADFESARNGAQVKIPRDGVRTATLPDGTQITARSTSSANLPTIQIIGPNGELVKIRYK